MGTLPRCLCLILTLCFAGLRPSTGGWNGAPHPDPLWGAKDAAVFKPEIDRAQRSGDYAALEQVASRAAVAALQKHAGIAAIRYLIYTGGARLALYRYRGALSALLEARTLAQQHGDRLDQAAIEINLSSLFLEMSDREAALQYAEQAYHRSRDLIQPYFEHHLLMQLGKIYALNRDPRAQEMLLLGIDAARAAGDVAQEARAWDLLGDEALRTGRNDDAERWLTEAFRLRKLFVSRDLPFSWQRLGALRLAQKRLDEAAQFTQRGIESERSSFPKFVWIHQRGEIELARGNRPAALRDFESAADLAAEWRRETLPSIATLTTTNIDLEASVFRSLVETEAKEALARHSHRLAVRAFEALEQNRSASLRQALAGRSEKGFPIQYWDALSEIRAEQARLLQRHLVTSPALEHARTKLTELDSEKEMRTLSKNEENFRTRNSLIHFQQVLSKSELFLSFHLGANESYAWAVTKEQFEIYRLGPVAVIRESIERFRDSVRNANPEAAAWGERVYRALFGELAEWAARKPDWIISADDALLSAPLAAVIVDRGPQRKARRNAGRKESSLTYLVERHSLRLVPGAMSLAEQKRKTQGRVSGGWLGLGDPIYNTADSRYSGPRPYSWPIEAAWFKQGPEPQLNRLVASGDELRSSARAWGSNAVLLEGIDATRDRFQSEIARHPAVIHMATHVLTRPQKPDEALIAFGLDRNGASQFLSTADVAALRVPEAVVTMAGCATGTGEIVDGAGLLGLTRAWQMAGAGTVIATLWPVPDSRGDLFSSFYRHLQTLPPARALQTSQVQMIHGQGWQRSPQYWSAYQANGGAR